MHPIVFQIGNLPIHSYGLCMAAGFFASLLLWKWLLKGTKWDTNRLSSLLTCIMISGIIGGRFAYVVEHFSEYKSFIAIISIHKGGLMFYGGFLGAGLGILLYCLYNKDSLLEVLDIVITALPLGHAFGRVGCFLNGCCHGRITEDALGVCFPNTSEAFYAHKHAHLLPPMQQHSLPVFPVQLFEASGNILVLALLIYLFRKKVRHGIIAATYLVSYPPLRFITEFFRDDQRLHLGKLSIAQSISIGLFALGIAIFVILAIHKPTNNSKEPQPDNA